MKKEITVALVVKNVARDIQEITERLLAQTCPRNKYEILVIDTGSTDETLSILDQYRDKIRVIKTNSTMGKARFMALKHAKAKIVAYLDGDAIPPKDFVSNFLKVFRKDKSIVCANYPSLTYPDRGFFYKCMAAFYEGSSAVAPWPGCKDNLWPGYRVKKYKR